MTLAHELPATGWCTFRLQTQWYALPVQRVREVLRPAALTPLPGAPPAVAGVLHLRGQIVTVIDPRACLGLPPAQDNAGALLLVHDGESVVSLCVDAVGDVLQACAGDLLPTPATLSAPLRARSLGMLRGNDILLLALDLDALLEDACPAARSATRASVAASLGGHA